MLTNKLHNEFLSQLFKIAVWLVVIYGLFYAGWIYAADPTVGEAMGAHNNPSPSIGEAMGARNNNNPSVIPTLDQALANLKTNIPSLMSLITAFAYLCGLYFVIIGIIELKHFGEMRTMMSSEHGLKKPLLHIFIGGFLIYLPSTIQTGLETLWATPYPTAYLTDASSASAWNLVVNNSFTIIQLIGVVAFIRGLIMLTHLGGHGGQQGAFAKGMTHIIGGILCINMYDTVRMIGATLGLGGVMGDILN